MAQQVASYVVRPSILRAASLAGYEYRRRVFCLKQGRAAARISPGRCSQHRFDSMAWSRVQLPEKKMGGTGNDLYQFLGWIFDQNESERKIFFFLIRLYLYIFIEFFEVLYIILSFAYPFDKYYYYNRCC